ncbi:hypothetical protein PK28_07305 [Hymenobacter sp. DG25B]|nr:hypothetical protein PK28_07305 [Hymenobacter sp. DG25B]
MLLSFGTVYGWGFVHSVSTYHQEVVAGARQLLQREWQDRTDSVTRVVILGSSLTGNGVMPSAYFTRKTNGRCRVVRLFRISANLESFTDRAPILKYLQEYPPDILCIEENLLLYDLKDWSELSPDSFLLKNVARYSYQLVNRSKQRLGLTHEVIDVNRPGLAMQDVDMPAPTTPWDTTHLTEFVAEIRQRKVRPFAPRHPVHQALRILRGQGVRIVLLHFPRPAPLEKAIYSGRNGDSLRYRIAQYQRAYQASYWHEPGPYHFRYFYDKAHMNFQGRALYSTWLAKKLRQETNPTLLTAR